MSNRILTALPVYNEVRHVSAVLHEVLQHADDVLVIDDGSTDGTSQILDEFPGIHVSRHGVNLGYGAALATAFRFAQLHNYDVLVTMDCDGQHQPGYIRQFADLIDNEYAPADMISGSRYMQEFGCDSDAPADRRRINARITACLNEKLGLRITDAFCGFKAYRVSALADLELSNPGYAMPLQLWVQAASLGWRIREAAVPRIYLDEKRSFGGALDDADVRLAHYHSVLNDELSRRGLPQRFTADCGAATVH
jgi:dolichol-phosphate mannosyltransferase